MRLPPWAKHIRRLPHPCQRSENPAETTAEGVLPIFGHQGCFRQCQQPHSGPHPKGGRHSPLSGLLGCVVPRRTQLHRGFPGRTRHPSPAERWHPPGLAYLPRAIPHLCSTPPVQNLARPDSRLCRQFRPDCGFVFRSREHPPPPKAVHGHQSQCSAPGHILLPPQDTAPTQEDPQPKALTMVPLTHTTSSAKTDLASDPPALRPDASAGYSASRASCAS